MDEEIRFKNRGLEMKINVKQPEKEKVDTFYGLQIIIDKKFQPDLLLYKRAHNSLKESQKARPDLIPKDFYPIEIKLPCDCSKVISNSKGLKTSKCKHGNYFVNIKISNPQRK